jgi:hypothetical protein
MCEDCWRIWNFEEAERKQRAVEEAEVSTMSYQDLAEPELRQLVLDICDNKVFTDRHCRNFDEVSLCFPVLMFMKLCDRKFIAANPPGLIWEFYSKAAPMSANGLPMFWSLHFLSPNDQAKLHPMVIAEFERRKAYLQEDPGEPTPGTGPCGEANFRDDDGDGE